jgi:ATP-binding cassette, subfamily B, bacterial
VATAVADRRNGWAVLLRLVNGQRRTLLPGVLGGLVWQSAGILVPVAIGWVIEGGVVAGDASVIWVGALIVMSVGLVEAVGAAVRHRSACTADERGKERMRDAMVADLLADEPGQAADLAPGELVGRVTGDIEELGGFLDTVSHTVAYLVAVPTVVVVLALIDPPLAIVVGTMIPLLTIVMWRYSMAWERRSAAVREAYDRTATSSAELVECFRGAAGLGVLDGLAARCAERSDQLRQRSVARARLWLIFEPVVEGISLMAVTVVVGVGGLRVIDGDLGVGGLVTAVGLAMLLTWPVRTLGERVVTVQTALASARRVARLLDERSSAASGLETRGCHAPAGARTPIDVELRAVTVDGPSGRRLPPTTLCLEPGDFVALSGPVGSGKSTLLEVLAGRLAPTTGLVLLGGVPAERWTGPAGHRRVIRVDAAPFLFADTLADNLRMAAPTASDDELWWALGLVDALGMVASLPAGLETMLGERGVDLSGGQRQRIGLARAILARPDVLLLDAATSALEPGRELQVLRALRDAWADRIVVVVSTNPGIDEIIDARLELTTLEVGA